MGNTRKLQITCVLFLFFILNQQIVFVHGRNLCRNCSKSRESFTSIATTTTTRDEGKSSRRVEYEVDDFRPTSPGHSPGVGHSINN